MTVTPFRMAMTTVSTVPATTSPQIQKITNTRLSNFSVASLLADHRPKSPAPIKAQSNATLNLTAISSCSPTSQHSHHSNHSNLSHHSNHSTEDLLDRSQTPHSSIGSEEFDDEDSIVDVEDMHQENSTNSKSPSLIPASLIGQSPIRPTPFSALAAAAAAWGGMGGGMPWQGRQMPPGFGPPGFFGQQGFPGQVLGG